MARKEYVLKKGQMKSVSMPTLGCDPEFFFKRVSDGVAINADYFLPHRTKMASTGHGGHLFFDGFQGEMNISAGACREGAVSRLRSTIRKAENIAKAKGLNDDEEYSIHFEPMTPVEPDILARAHEEAREFGCDPDFCAYNLCTNPPGPDAGSHFFRYAGGHIHIGGEKLSASKTKHLFNQREIPKFIQLLDIIAGVPMVLLDRDGGNIARRELYGRAGCYRQQKYGVEYRTPSNFWLKAPELASFMLGLTRLAFNVAYLGLQDYFTKVVDQDAVRFAIDFNDFEVAKELWGILKNNVVHASVGSDSMAPSYSAKFSDGNHSVVTNFPGYVMFEYIVKNGGTEFFKNHKYEWSLGGGKAQNNGWYSGMTKRLWNTDYTEFSEFYKEAVPLDNVAF